MIAILIFFYIMIAFFAGIGAIRGWAKEVLVIFSAVLALALIYIIENLMPGISTTLKNNPTMQYWVRTGIFIFLVFFGYQSPRIARIGRAAERRDQIQDSILGFLLGAVSGYMVIGTLWWFLDARNYFPPYITAPPANTPLGETAELVLGLLPPAFLLKSPTIFIVVVLAFIFVMVVFV